MTAPRTTSPMPMDKTMMIGIFSFINAFFTFLGTEEDADAEGTSAASIAAWSGGADVDAGAPVWFSRTLTKSACAEAGFVVDSSCTYGAAVVLTLPSTKSPKLMSRYTFRTASLLLIQRR